MKKAVLIILILFTKNKIALAQNISVLECHYKMKIISNGDTSVIKKVVWMGKDEIYEFNQEDPSKHSLYDFSKRVRILNLTGLIHTLDLSLMRMEGQCSVSVNKINNFRSNMTLTVPENHEVVYLDSAVLIPGMKKGFRDFIDNGLGYLPVYSERKTQLMQDDKMIDAIIKISLESIEKKIIDQKSFIL